MKQKHRTPSRAIADMIRCGMTLHGETIETEFPDKMLNTSEHYHLWVIETKRNLDADLPFRQAGLNVIVTKDGLEKYRTRKVRILNGAHTSFVTYGLLQGFQTVRECLQDETMLSFIRSCIFDEIIPTLDFPADALTEYAESVRYLKRLFFPSASAYRAKRNAISIII